MYNILYKLMDTGFISSYEKIVGRKIRIYYHIEDTGQEYLTELIKEFYQMVQSIIEEK